MDPVCFHIGHRPIYWYGVMVAAGFLAALIHWNLLARREGRPSAFASDMAFWLMLSGLVGARIAYITANWNEFRAEPLSMIRIDQGGLIYYGGFIMAVLTTIVLARVHKENLMALGDFLITGIPLGHALGRIGCFLNGCCFGSSTVLPWAVTVQGVGRHPVQLYEAAYNLLLYGLLLFVFLRRKKDGQVFALYLLVYGAGRLVLEWFRGDDRLQWLHLTVAQVISVFAILIGLALWLFLPEAFVTATRQTGMNKTLQLVVPLEDTGIRLDLWLSRHIPDLSRSRIQGLIETGHITQDGLPLKGHKKTKGGEQIRIFIPEPAPINLAAENIPIEILHEDEAILVINKPAGLVVHPAAGHRSGTLVNALLHHCRDLAGIGGELRPGLVHRLDKDTSGVMVIAKNESAMAWMIGQFKTQSVLKEYLALVWGRPKPPAGRIETLIGRHPRDRKKMSVLKGKGRKAVTHYETIECLPETTLLRIRIETGRTHQIRVHLSHIGYPVVGDRQYGCRSTTGLGMPVSRQMLHARRIVFMHPVTHAAVDMSAPLPEDMAILLQMLKTGKRKPKSRLDKPPHQLR